MYLSRPSLGGEEGKHAAKLQRSYLQLRVPAETIGGGACQKGLGAT